MNEVLRVKNFLDSIKNTTKRKEKESIILDNKDNELFMKTLHFICNPFITTGLSKSKICKDVKFDSELSKSLIDAMNYIANNNTGRDEDIALIRGYIENYTDDPSCVVFLNELFTKSYSVGIGASSINKVIDGFIPQFDVMLANNYDKNKKFVVGKEFIITYKLDGMRVICINDGVTPLFYTRQGNPIEGLVELEEEFKLLPDGVYDGELLLDGKYSESKDLFQATMKVARSNGNKKNLIMYCFDYIENIDDFSNGVCYTPCYKRKDQLESIIKDNQSKSIYHIKYLKQLYKGYDEEIIVKAMQHATKIKMEGLMINLSDAPYECKRTKNLLKVKTFNTVDLRVIGYEEGSGEFVGTLGALLVDYKGYTVKVGSGLTHMQRAAIWNKKDDIVGSIVEVQYFEETKSQNGGISLRFPVFLRIRDDKDDPSLH